MKNEAPLFLAFEQEILPHPQGSERFIAIGLHDTPPSEWHNFLDIIQPWRPDYLRLEKAGFKVFPQIGCKTLYDGGLLVLNKHRRRNENRFLQLLSAIRPGGLIVVCGDKTVGGVSFRKWVSKIIEIENSLAKNHAVSFWLRVPDRPDEHAIEALQNPTVKTGVYFETAPGMFSHEKIDEGSALLAKCLPAKLKGKAADFGAGWGYLAAMALRHIKGITALDLYEADYEALEAARNNLAALHDTIPVGFYWQDLTSEQPGQLYDTVISNPPFHQGRAADTALGQAFIRAAARSLNRQGQLFLVANRHLPYEVVLHEQFRSVEQLETTKGFKVICARK